MKEDNKIPLQRFTFLIEVDVKGEEKISKEMMRDGVKAYGLPVFEHLDGIDHVVRLKEVRRQHPTRGR